MGFWNDQDHRVIVTGGGGFLGGAILQALGSRGLDAAHIYAPRSDAFDLRTAKACAHLLREAFGGPPPTVVIHAAGTVGGIGATSTRPGEFFHDNAAMTLNLIEAFRTVGLIDAEARFVMVGTAASYPVDAPLPLAESSLWQGFPSDAGASYGLAKLMGLEMLDAYARQYAMRSSYLVPINIYGPRDHFDPDRSHVVAALVRRFVEAADRADPEVVCWGSGAPTRDFLFVDDAAEGIVLAAERMTEPTPINLGTGVETPIRTLAETIARAAGFTGTIRWDASKPDGAPRRVVDIARARERLGWSPRVALDEGVRRTVEWFREHGS